MMYMISYQCRVETKVQSRYGLEISCFVQMAVSDACTTLAFSAACSASFEVTLAIERPAKGNALMDTNEENSYRRKKKKDDINYRREQRKRERYSLHWQKSFRQGC